MLMNLKPKGVEVEKLNLDHSPQRGGISIFKYSVVLVQHKPLLETHRSMMIPTEDLLKSFS